jgi:cytochrome c biogenesis protein CcdA
VGDLLTVVGTALWLGILTSISPCPLATNIAAISFIGRGVNKPRKVLFSGLLYTLGRTLAYVGLAALLVTSLLNAPGISHFLQKYMNALLGPLLVVMGLFLLELIEWSGSGRAVGERMQARVEAWGLLGAVLLGVVFALSMCPVSAVFFFGSLIPLAVKHESSVILPAIYGVGTALPVIVFAGLIAVGARSLGVAFNRVSVFAKWARWITGAVFVLVGIYLALVYIYDVL